MIATSKIDLRMTILILFVIIIVCVLDEVQKKLKTAYNHICNSDHPHCYIQLALVRDEMCNIRDKKLNKITRHTLQGQVDEILKIKEPLKTLEDVFHFKNSPCSRLLLVLGAPGNSHRLVICVCYNCIASYNNVPCNP